MRACCYAGHPLVNGAPRGRIQQICGVPCYSVDGAEAGNSSSNKNNVVVVLPDIFGSTSYSKTLCDNMAATSGCHVVLVDCFRGQGISARTLEIVSPIFLPQPADAAPRSLWTRVWRFLVFFVQIWMVLPTVAVFLWRFSSVDRVGCRLFCCSLARSSEKERIRCDHQVR